MRYNKSVGCAGVALFLLLLSCGTAKESRRPKGAEESVVRLSDKNLRKFDYLYLEGNRLEQDGLLDASFDLLRHAAAIDTSNAAVKYGLASYYLQLNQPLVAYDLIKEAAAAEKENYWYGMMLANLARNLGDYDQAEQAYAALVENNPSKPELNYMLADIYAQKGELEKAIGAYDQLEASMGMMEMISLQKAKLYKLMGEDEKSYAEIERLIRAFPHDVGYLLMLGDIYLSDNRPDQAWEMYLRAEELEPDNGYLPVSKASYYHKLGDEANFQAEMQRALLNRNLDVESKINILTDYLADCLQKKESLDRAYVLFDELQAMHPQEEGIYSLYAELLLSQKKYREAAEQLQVTVDLAPTEKSFWLQLMGVYLQLDEYDEMVRTGERALEYLPDATEIYVYMGVGYAAEKKYDRAIEILTKGLPYLEEANLGMKSEYYGQLGDAYYLSGDKEKAFEAFELAVKYNPGNVGVLNNYSYFLALDKRELSKAERMSGEVIKAEPDNPTYLDTYAWVFFQQGNYTLAKFYLERALSKAREDKADLYEHYGDTLYMLGNPDEALEYWEKAANAGCESAVLPRKIKDKKYYEE
ncbi:MAG: tetratricopeptide repeat protein [Coprobacter sp.]|nr:tetratricopeptide repeat protein [Coprobacter sp.]